MFQWVLNLLKPKEKPIVSKRTMEQYQAKRFADIPKPKRPNRPSKPYSRGKSNDSSIYIDSGYNGSNSNSSSSCSGSSDSGSTGGGGCE